MASYDRDYVTTLPLLKEKANIFSEGKWNKYDGDIGETLIKFLASTSHTVDYYFKRYLNNLILPNSDWTSKSLVWELTGYKPPYIRADYLMVQLYWPNCGLLSYVPIYMYTPFKVIADGTEYTFMAAEDYLIPPMTSKINIKLVEGSLRTVEVDYTKVVGNKILISETPIDYDLVTLNVSGENWRQVRNVFYEPSTEKIFSLHREEDGIYLYLHPTWQQYIDEYNPLINLYFVDSTQTFDDYTEDCISISFKEPVIDTFGVDVSSFYRIFPLINKETGVDIQPTTMEGDRVITTDDYTSKALLYPGVATCKAYSWDTPSVVREPFKVVLIASGFSGFLRERTKDSLKSYLSSIGSPLLEVDIADPVYRDHSLRVVLDVGDFKNTLVDIQIRLAVQAVLRDYYSLGNMPPGTKITEKDLNSIILRSDTRILFADTSFMNIPIADPFSIPVLGSVMVITDASSVPTTDFGTATEQITVYNSVEKADSGIARETLTEFKASIKLGDEVYHEDHFTDSDRYFIDKESIVLEKLGDTERNFVDFYYLSQESLSCRLGASSGNGEVLTAAESISIEKLDPKE